MSTAAQLDLEIDQGSDFSTQIYWTSGAGVPFYVQSPMRMEIRNQVGGVVVTLQTTDTSEQEDLNGGDDQSILFNAESGLIQLYMSDEKTDLLAGGNEYSYDLFVHYADNDMGGKVRKRRLIAGRVFVNGRVTQNV